MARVARMEAASMMDVIWILIVAWLVVVLVGFALIAIWSVTK